MRVFGNIMNRIAEHTGGTPTVGMGATVCMYSDRHAGTVVEILSPSRIVVQRDHAKRTDGNGMSDSQSYDYEPNPQGQRQIFTKRKNGAWKEFKGSDGLRLGDRDEYYDFGF